MAEVPGVTAIDGKSAAGAGVGAGVGTGAGPLLVLGVSFEQAASRAAPAKGARAMNRLRLFMVGFRTT